MSDICTDNRFELIAKYKAKLIEATNIETSADEMAVIDNILFRVWQMGWFDRLEQPTVDAVQVVRCGECKNWEEKPLANGNGTRFGTCPLMMGLFFKSDFYCADGKRKNNETKLKGE